MLRGHVFIVNEEGLPVHLRHMFVGTTAGRRADNNISLLADMHRVKSGDLAFFYIEATSQQKGRFFGIFRIKDEIIYHLTGEDAYQPELPVKLIYRRKIEPYKVFSKGVLEWIGLDKLPTFSKELLWSLIYRKMKGGRGNTMLLPWETERLVSLIEDANEGKNLTGDNFSYNKETAEIYEAGNTFAHNHGEEINLSDNIAKKNESSLQAVLLKNLSIGRNTFLSEIFGENISWLGNEVFAGSGMQKIDLFTIEQKDPTSCLYRIIELKHPKSTANIHNAPNQLEYYIKWAREDHGGHIIGGRQFNVKPILLNFTTPRFRIDDDIIDKIKKLSEISNAPEIWEIDSNLDVNKR